MKSVQDPNLTGPSHKGLGGDAFPARDQSSKFAISLRAGERRVEEYLSFSPRFRLLLMTASFA